MPATQDHFYLLHSPSGALRLPTPPQMRNAGNYVVSLSRLCRWLAARAEAAGVDIFPGFAASEPLYSADGSGAVAGVATNDFGVAKDGRRKDSYSPGVELAARVTLLAEGCRGSLSERIMERFRLRQAAGADPQTYTLGLKEVWEVPEGDNRAYTPGMVYHTVGYPLDSATYGGGFM